MTSIFKHRQALGSGRMPVLILDMQNEMLGKYFYQHGPALLLGFLTPGGDPSCCSILLW